MTTARRLYFYAVSLVTLGIWSWGVGLLINLIIDVLRSASPVLGSPDYFRQQLSLVLAMTVIGVPLWIVHWRVVQRHASASAQEAASAIRKLYFSLVLTATAIVSLVMGIRILAWAFSGFNGPQFGSGIVAAMVVSLGLWYFHWKADATDGQASPAGQTLRRWYWYIVSATALTITAVSFAGALSESIQSSGLFGAEPLARGPLWSTQMQTRAASVLLAGLWWAFHWFVAAGKDADSSLRRVYLYLYTILGGSVLGLVMLTITLFQLLRLAFGVQPGPVGESYFRFLTWTIPGMLVGFSVWTYHWQKAKEESLPSEESRLSTRRVYYYLQSGIGLAALAAGVVILIGLLVDIAISYADPSYPITVSPGWWRDPLALFLVLTLVGTAMWSYHWLNMQRQAEADPGQRAARSRRVYLYTFLCVGIIAAAAGLINLVYRILSAVLVGATALDLLDNLKWSLQALAVSVPALVYHWGVLREDMRAGAERQVDKKRALLAVVDEAAMEGLVPRLEAALGIPVKVVSLRGVVAEPPAMAEERFQALVREIQASTEQKLMLLAHGGEVKLYPYSET